MLFLFYLVLSMQLQDDGATISKIDAQLGKGVATTSSVLSNPAYMELHSQAAFRNLIKKHAKAAPLRMITAKEPGNAVIIKVKLLSGKGPAKNTLVYVYQTDARGQYAAYRSQVDEGNGNSAHARLFGYVRTNEQGELELQTIRPASYPNSSIPQHIHLEAFDASGKTLIVTELLFDDDPNLVGETRREMLQRFVVAKNTGTKDQQVFSYVVNVSN